jgi:hypothetical protein
MYEDLARNPNLKSGIWKSPGMHGHFREHFLFTRLGFVTGQRTARFFLCFAWDIDRIFFFFSCMDTYGHGSATGGQWR